MSERPSVPDPPVIRIYFTICSSTLDSAAMRIILRRAPALIGNT
ncbi:MAG: hypothetical protein ABIZ57_08585 [Candidatus Limnocylindria bacterium]